MRPLQPNLNQMQRLVALGAALLFLGWAASSLLDDTNDPPGKALFAGLLLLIVAFARSQQEPYLPFADRIWPRRVYIFAPLAACTVLALSLLNSHWRTDLASEDAMAGVAMPEVTEAAPAMDIAATASPESGSTRFPEIAPYTSGPQPSRSDEPQESELSRALREAAGKQQSRPPASQPSPTPSVEPDETDSKE
jgi:hypothetical protein